MHKIFALALLSALKFAAADDASFMDFAAKNNKNYRTPTSTPSFSNQNKQSVKTGYEEVSHPVGFKHNVKRSFSI